MVVTTLHAKAFFFFSHSNGNCLSCVSPRWVKIHPGLRHFLIWPSGLFSPTTSFDQNRRVFFLSTLLFRHKHVNNRSPSKNVTKRFGLVWGHPWRSGGILLRIFSPIERNRRKIFRWLKTFERDRGVKFFLSYCKCVVRPPRESKRFCVSSPNRRQSCRGAAETKIQT